MNWFKKLFHLHRWFITGKQDANFQIKETGKLVGFTLLDFECKCGKTKSEILLHKEPVI